jgi:hypothetical protein
MLIQGDYVRLTRDVVDGCTRLEEGLEGEVLDPPDAEGVFTLKDGPCRWRVPADAAEEAHRPVIEEHWVYL